MGEAELLNKYFHEGLLSSLGGYSETARFTKLDHIEVPYEVVSYSNEGRYNISHEDPHILTNVRTSRQTGRLQFSIAADFSSIPYPNAYFSQANKYQCSLSYSISEIVQPEQAAFIAIDVNPTHIITVKSAAVPYGQLTISLKDEIPNWISASSIDDDSGEKIIGNTTQTFGLKQLTDGVSMAYSDLSSIEYICNIELLIQR